MAWRCRSGPTPFERSPRRRCRWWSTSGLNRGGKRAIFTGGPQHGNVGVGFASPIDAVRQLLPELRTGTITRGRIGVQITPVTKNLVEPLGLDDAGGALVRLVYEGGPAVEAGIEPDDVIVRYNGKPVGETGDLVEMVSRTKPGTTVPLEIVRDGERRTLRVRVASLDIDEDTGQTRAPAETGLGMTLSDLTPQMRGQLRVPPGRSGAVVTSVQQGGIASRAGIRGGDVLLEVNRTAVKSASIAAAALQRMKQGDTAFALIWRQGQELFVTMTRG